MEEVPEPTAAAQDQGDPHATPSLKAPPGAGAFESGHADTAERAEEILEELGFGEGAGWEQGAGGTEGDRGAADVLPQVRAGAGYGGGRARQ
jgi:hypothetical protein